MWWWKGVCVGGGGVDTAAACVLYAVCPATYLEKVAPARPLAFALLFLLVFGEEQLGLKRRRRNKGSLSVIHTSHAGCGLIARPPDTTPHPIHLPTDRTHAPCSTARGRGPRGR